MRTENVLHFSTSPQSGKLPFKTRHKSRKSNSDQEFRIMLESYLTETAEDLEEHQILFPKHGKFWDNGYEDVG